MMNSDVIAKAETILDVLLKHDLEENCTHTVRDLFKEMFENV
jgi:hypothetical protein